VYVATLAAGKDPADAVKLDGPEAVAKALEEAVPLIRFLLSQALVGAELTTPEGRTRAVRRGAEVLGQVGDSFLRHEYTLWLADRVGVDSYEVTRVVDAKVGGASKDRRANAAPPVRAPKILSGSQRVEREALRVLLTVQEAFDDAELIPLEGDFTLPLHRALFRLVMTEHAEQRKIDPGRIAARIADEELRGGLSELVVGQTPDDATAREVLHRLKEFALGRNIEERKQRLRGLDPDRDAAAYDALFEELLTLEARRRARS
jgi:DNA primase